MVNASMHAIKGPERSATMLVERDVSKCRPKTASTSGFNRTPSSIMKRAPAAPSSPAAAGSDWPFSLGQAVVHPKFGEGTVMAFEGAGEHTRVQVNFSNAGSKWLVLAYAKLQAR